MKVIIAVEETEIFASPGGKKIGVLPKGWAVKYAGEEEGQYFVVYLFSGENRYLPKSKGKKGALKTKLPPTEVAKFLYKKMAAAETDAQNKADALVPAQNIAENTKICRELTDNYKLKIFLAKGVSPMHQSRIAVEGATQNWPMR